MGITIHYRFMVRNKDAVLRLLSEAKALAIKLGMKLIQEQDTMLVLHPHPKCESIQLEFCKWKEAKAREGWDYCKETMQDYEKVLADDDYVCSGFTKTQFAGFKAHIVVAEFLRRMASRCTLSYVSDEADYYETMDMEKGAKNFEANAKMIRKFTTYLKEHFGAENVYSSMEQA